MARHAHWVELADRRAPTVLERYVALADGGLVHIRHPGPDDRAALVAHHERCSDDSRRRRRVLGATPPTSLSPIDRPLRHDGRGHVAVGAFDGDDVVGLARYDLDLARPDADLSVAVEDRHQRRGIGTLLVRELALLACAAHVRRLRAVTLRDDDRLPTILRRAALDVTVHDEGGLVVLECSTTQAMSASA
jgi:GNAT superfamily N-acetyltransferase